MKAKWNKRENNWKIVEQDNDWHKLNKTDSNRFNANRSYDENNSNPNCNPNCNPKQHCDEKKDHNKCHYNNFLCTLISVKNPTTELVIPVVLGIAAASAPIPIIGDTVDLGGWVDLTPDALGLFDNLTGTYTVPENGDYQIELTINYETSVSLPVSILLNNVPFIEIYDIDSSDHILGSQFPTVSLVIPIPPLSSGDIPVDVSVAALLGKGQVIINAVVPLIAGQRIRVRAVTNGLTFNPLGPLEIIPALPARIVFDPEEGIDTTLAIYKLRNTPIVTVHCNN